MALENGDFFIACSASPFAGFSSGQARDAINSFSEVQTTAANACAISPDGSMVAFGHSSGSMLYVYSLASGARITAASFSTGQIKSLAFSPDSSKLAIGHMTSPYVTILNTSTWAKLADPATLPTGQGNGVAWSPDGSKLAVAHNTSPFLTVYNTSDWSKMANPASIPNVHSLCVDWSPDGTKIAVGLNATPYVRLVNASDLTPAASAPSVSSAGQINAIAYSPNGSKLAIGTSSSAYLRALNTSDWSSVTLPSPTSQVYSLAWTCESEIIAGLGAYPRLSICDLTTQTISSRSFIGGTVNGIAAKKYTPTAISGTVLDSNNNAVSRTIRAYRRDTGEMAGSAVSNPSTGAYSISCRYSGEHDVVLLDDAAGTLENDQILRTTPV